MYGVTTTLAVMMAATGLQPLENVAFDRVDLIELNHFTDPVGISSPFITSSGREPLHAVSRGLKVPQFLGITRLIAAAPRRIREGHV